MAITPPRDGEWEEGEGSDEGGGEREGAGDKGELGPSGRYVGLLFCKGEMGTGPRICREMSFGGGVIDQAGCSWINTCDFTHTSDRGMTLHRFIVNGFKTQRVV